jgi:hypothetical protein
MGRAKMALLRDLLIDQRAFVSMNCSARFAVGSLPLVHPFLYPRLQPRGRRAAAFAGRGVDQLEILWVKRQRDALLARAPKGEGLWWSWHHIQPVGPFDGS